MLRAYKYSLVPTFEQKQKLETYFGCVRFIFNLGIETKMRAWQSARKSLTYVDLANQMKELKDTEASWLKECPAQALQMSLRNLDQSFVRFFKGGGFPKFKSKRSRQSIQFPQDVIVNFFTNSVRIPKLGAISCIFHRIFKGRIKTATVSKTTTGKYFISILVDNQYELPKKKLITEETTVGIDVGIKTLAVLSDGSSFENPKFLRRSLKRLRSEQRRLGRRFKKGQKEQSNSYQKQKLIVARLHEKIRNQRDDYLQKMSTSIVRSFDTICLEDLNVKGMMKNKKLSLSIGEIGWSKFTSMLEYKSEWHGKNIIYIGKFDPSSKLCSSCGSINKELTLKDRIWTCKSCNSTHDRDVNAAINIKTFGLRNKPSTVNVSH